MTGAGQGGAAGVVQPVSMRLGDKDVMMDGFVLSGDSPPPLRITLAAAFGTLSGTLLDASDQPVAGGVVYIAPAQGGYRGTGRPTGANPNSSRSRPEFG